MDITAIQQRIDAYYEQNKGEEAEQYMLGCIKQAVEEGEDAVLLQLLNELLGYYREVSRVESSYAVAAQALSLAEKLGLQESLQYATTLLNVANAYRAGGRLEDSLSCYQRVQEIYLRHLEPEDMLMASLYNNISLLYQEMGKYGNAKEKLLNALNIVRKKKADFEVAVTYANLASTSLQLKESEAAFEYAQHAIAGFETLGVADFHYGAALSALGTYYYGQRKYEAAKDCFSKARDIMEQSLGQNEYYQRLTENLAECDRAMTAGDKGKKGLELCRAYYEAYGRPMIAERFPEYESRIAVGLVGAGSDCFGYDDALSRDHDWGPDFCMWVTKETYGEIGEALELAYRQLPEEFQGYRRTKSAQGAGRRGVMTISGFYKSLLQTAFFQELDWQQVSDAALAAAVNGEVFRDDEGIFTAVRRQLQQGYPERILYLKLAEAAARFAQTGQYNYGRMQRRGDKITARMMLADAAREAMKLRIYMEGIYPPHDKWLRRCVEELPGGRRIIELLNRLTEGNGVEVMEELAELLVRELYERNLISDIDTYLGAHTEELLLKAGIAPHSNEELAEIIAKLEFEAFDKVRNVGGRADCQNDWPTFSIMRKSQYLTWNRTMLMQYYYDFKREYERGHNLIEEKYGRMMESTAPAEYKRIREHFPELSEEKKAIIEAVVAIQVGWMEEFAGQYPHLAENARSVRTTEDHLYNTSYETYLRGEISTYSDKMLELYGRFVVECAKGGRNLAYESMTNSAHLYGYSDLAAAERFLGL